MGDLVREKKVTAISDIRDESARGKLRVVIDLKKDAYPKKVLNQLYKHTPLQNSFHYNMLALVDGIQPRVLGIVDIIKEHLKHRRQVVRRRAEFELKQARDRSHILEGLSLALDHIDAIIALIRGSETTESAKEALIKKFKLTDIQASAILAMQLRSLAGLERKKVLDELAELNKLIGKLEKLLASEAKILEVVRDELLEVKEKLNDKRRSQIIAHDLDKFSDEDLIPNEQVLVTLTIINYIKRSLASEYKQQGRGGKGRRGMSTRDEDLIHQMIFANTHDNLFFFTNTGRVFKLKCYEVPPARLDAKGTNIANLLQLRSDESVSAMFKIGKENVDADGFLFMCTKQGVVKKTPLGHYQNLRQNGLINIRLDQGDELKWVRLSSGRDEVIISTAKGQANRFSESDVRPMGRNARGVRGIRLRPGDSVVGMDLVRPDVEVVLLSKNGYGKRTKMEQFAAHKRGGVGVRSAALSDRTGDLVAVRSLGPRAKEIVAISERGKTIRVDVKKINRLQRATQGVRLMRLDKGDSVVSLVVIEESEEEAAEAAEKGRREKKPARAGRQKRQGEGWQVMEWGGFLYPATAAGAWLLAQAIKIIVSSSSKLPRISWQDLVTSGGMPSSHVALVTSMALVIGWNEGFDSAVFGVILTIWGVVLYDSVGVRRATGENTKMISRMLSKLKIGDQRTALHLALGHTPFQSFAGFLVGLGWGFLIQWLLGPVPA